MRSFRIVVTVLFIICLASYIGMGIVEDKTTDTDGPEFALESDEPLSLSVEDGDDVLLSGITASDSKDGDLTDEIIISGHSYFSQEGTCTVKYYVFDSDNNFASLSRTVTYTDYESPTFTITDPITYAAGSSTHVIDYLQAYDVLDGDLTSQIVITENNINTSYSGIYSVTAQVTNSYGDIEEIVFNVVVRESDSPSITLTENLVYIETGDDFEALDYISSVASSSGTLLVREEGSTLIWSQNSEYLGSIVIDDGVDTSEEGCYQVVYSLNTGSGTGYACLSVVVR